jgi:drug/metabolite transporter, DME family
MKRHNLITVVVCIAGLSFFLIDQDQAGHSWLGDGIALLGGFFSAGMILALRFSNRSQQMSGILLGNIWVVLITMPWFFRSGPATGTEHLMLAYLGFIQIGIGFLLFTYGQRRIPAVESSLIAMLEPILSPLWVLIWYGEKPAVWSLIGGGIILLAIAGRMIYLKKFQSTPDTPLGV